MGRTTVKEHPNTTLSRQHFNRMAERYDSMFVPRLGGYEAMHGAILAMLPAPDMRPVRVLELGMGTGNLTAQILELLPHSSVVGYDLSARMLDQARAKLASMADRVQLIEADMDQASLAGPFDVAVSAIAIHHVPPRAKPALFRRLHGALRPGGVLIIGDTFRAPTPELDTTYRRLRTPDRPDPDAAAYESYRQQAGPAGGSSTYMQHYFRWMQQAGFCSVDCVWKHFSLAVVYGERPRVP